MKNKKKWLMLFLRIFISFGLIGYFLYALADKHGGLDVALKQFGQAFAQTSVVWLIPAFFLHLIGFMLVSFRWKILLGAQGVEARYRQLFSYYFMAAFFNTFLPSTIGGDTIRAVESKKHTGSATTSIMVVIIERLTGLMALVLIVAIGLAIKFFQGPSTQREVWIFLVLVLGGFIVAIVCLHPRVAPSILKLFKKILPAKIYGLAEKAYQAVAAYYRKPSALFGALGISLIFQFNMVIYYYLIASALHQNPDPVDFMTKVPVMIFLLMTVPAINGLGIRTAGFKGLMEFPAAYALAVEFIDLGFRLTYGLLGGLFFMFYKRSHPEFGARTPDSEET